MERWRITSIEEFDRQFPQTQYLYNWCQDFEMELGNAALKERKYAAARLELSRQITPLIAAKDRLTRENFKRALAELHYALGDAAAAEQLYRQWLEADPRWGWGWIGWSDLDGVMVQGANDPRKEEEILTRALQVSGLRDRAEVLERLSELYRETGQKDKRSEVVRQLDLIASRSRAAGVSGGPDSPAGQDVGPGHAGEKNKVGRNDPCPCGSGRKYKRCCGG